MLSRVKIVQIGPMGYGWRKGRCALCSAVVNYNLTKLVQKRFCCQCRLQSLTRHGFSVHSPETLTSRPRHTGRHWRPALTALRCIDKLNQSVHLDGLEPAEVERRQGMMLFPILWNFFSIRHCPLMTRAMKLRIYGGGAETLIHRKYWDLGPNKCHSRPLPPLTLPFPSLSLLSFPASRHPLKYS